MGDKLRFRCDVGWENMTPLGDGRRHCARCDKPVHDLTRLTRKQAERFRRENPGACVHVVARADTQELVFAPEPRRRLPVREAAVAAALAMGCSARPSSDGPPMPVAEPPVVQAPVVRPPEPPRWVAEPPMMLPLDVSQPASDLPVGMDPPAVVEVPTPAEAPPTRRARPRRAATVQHSTADAGPPPPVVHRTFEVIDGGW